jgi:hypothetical protein
LLEAGQTRPLSRTQKWLLAAAVAGVILAISGVFGTGFLFWRVLRATPAAPATLSVIHVVVTATAAPSVPSPVPTVRRGVMRGNAWAREGPSADAAPMRVVRIGLEVQILDAAGDRLLVRWASGTGAELTGWVAGEQVEQVEPVASAPPVVATALPPR